MQIQIPKGIVPFIKMGLEPKIIYKGGDVWLDLVTLAKSHAHVLLTPDDRGGYTVEERYGVLRSISLDKPEYVSDLARDCMCSSEWASTFWMQFMDPSELADDARAKALDELTRISQELGLYT